MIKNARIVKTVFGREDHGIMTFTITVQFHDGAMKAIGGYALDQYYRESDKCVFSAAGLEAISKILEAAGVRTWEELPGKYIRLKDNGWGTTIDEIGNIIDDDKWFNIRECFANSGKGENV